LILDVPQLGQRNVFTFRWENAFRGRKFPENCGSAFKEMLRRSLSESANNPLRFVEAG